MKKLLNCEDVKENQDQEEVNWTKKKFYFRTNQNTYVLR